MQKQSYEKVKPSTIQQSGNNSEKNIHIENQPVNEKKVISNNGTIKEKIVKLLVHGGTNFQTT